MTVTSSSGQHGDLSPHTVGIPQAHPQRLFVGPIAIQVSTRAEFVERILHIAFTSDVTHLVATANAQFYVLASRERNFAEILQSAELVCADGISIVVACFLLNGRAVERITGIDLISELCRAGANNKLRIFLLGGHPGSASAAAKLILNRYPGIEVTGVACPPLGFENNNEELRLLRDTLVRVKPHIVLVGLGAPKQEFFIQEHIRPLGIPIAIGVGGSFEMFSGRRKRAPRWIQIIGLEWGFRLMQEPSRLWRRYLIGNCQFIFYLLRELIEGHQKY